VLLVLFGGGVAAATVFTGMPEENLVAFAAAGVFLSAGILYAAPYWAVVVVLIGVAWGVLPGLLASELAPVAAGITFGLLISPSVEIIREWDKIVVLRLGRFHRVRGPGPVVLLPLLDSVAGYVDTRIRVSDFSAEKSLTADTVPVHVDALAFWMIWDAGKAILEVEHFAEAVVLSAQTALRASIGANDLATLLSERERLGQEIREIVDAKTNPWGITILSVEFKEILIPHELEDVLSREAQASREHSARVILSRSEAEIAESYARAADTYRNDPVALQIRAMNMIYEGIRAKGGLVMVPSDALKGMNLGTVLGAGAYNNDVTDSGDGGTKE
jgi:regulator of protease activity HflC (stomatin/prohibitin superfamily)